MDLLARLKTSLISNVVIDRLFVPTYSLDTVVKFYGPSATESARYIGEGWSSQEETHRWTDGQTAKLVFKLTKTPKNPLMLKVHASPFLGGGLNHQYVRLLVNGQEVIQWSMKGLAWYECPIPSYLIKQDGIILLSFIVDTPLSPSEIGESTDSRKLGIAMRELIICEQPEEGSLKNSSDRVDIFKPACLIVETVNDCNHDCVFCAKKSLRRTSAIMPLDLFEKIVHEHAAYGGGYVSLTPMIGDIFLDPYLLERLRIIERYSSLISLSVTTNVVLTDRYDDTDLRYILSMFKKVHISVYGLSENEYSMITNRTVYARFLSSFHRVVNFAGGDKLALGFRFLFNHPEKVIKKWMDDNLCSHLPYASTIQYCKWPNARLPISLPGDAFWVEPKQQNLPCLVPLLSMQVYADGDVSLCACSDFNASEELKLGTLREASLQQVLKCEKIQSFFSVPWEMPNICKACSFYRPITEVEQTFIDDPTTFIGG